MSVDYQEIITAYKENKLELKEIKAKLMRTKELEGRFKYRAVEMSDFWTDFNENNVAILMMPENVEKLDEMKTKINEQLTYYYSYLLDSIKTFKAFKIMKLDTQDYSVESFRNIEIEDKLKKLKYLNTEYENFLDCQKLVDLRDDLKIKDIDDEVNIKKLAFILLMFGNFKNAQIKKEFFCFNKEFLMALVSFSKSKKVRLDDFMLSKNREVQEDYKNYKIFYTAEDFREIIENVVKTSSTIKQSFSKVIELFYNISETEAEIEHIKSNGEYILRVTEKYKEISEKFHNIKKKLYKHKEKIWHTISKIDYYELKYKYKHKRYTMKKYNNEIKTESNNEANINQENEYIKAFFGRLSKNSSKENQKVEENDNDYLEKEIEEMDINGIEEYDDENEEMIDREEVETNTFIKNRLLEENKKDDEDEKTEEKAETGESEKNELDEIDENDLDELEKELKIFNLSEIAKEYNSEDSLENVESKDNQVNSSFFSKIDHHNKEVSLNEEKKSSSFSDNTLEKNGKKEQVIPIMLYWFEREDMTFTRRISIKKLTKFFEKIKQIESKNNTRCSLFMITNASKEVTEKRVAEMSKKAIANDLPNLIEGALGGYSSFKINKDRTCVDLSLMSKENYKKIIKILDNTIVNDLREERVNRNCQDFVRYQFLYRKDKNIDINYLRSIIRTILQDDKVKMQPLRFIPFIDNSGCGIDVVLQSQLANISRIPKFYKENYEIVADKAININMENIDDFLEGND